MNIAFFGFSIAGIIFLVYGSSLLLLVGKKIPKYLAPYGYAYLGLGIAFLLWAYATVNITFLPDSVMLGDTILLLGTICMISILTHNSKKLQLYSIIGGIVLAFTFLWLRANLYPVTAFMKDGVLVFNTQPAIAILLGAIFFLIWLPANIKVGKIVTSHISEHDLQIVYSFVYGLSTLAAVLFISVRSPQFAIAAFVILAGCFAILLYSNYVISKTAPLLPPEIIVPKPIQPVTPVPPQVFDKPKYKTANWLALAYIVLVVLTFWNPSESVANILFFVTGGFGIIAGLGFIVMCVKATTRVKNPVLSVFIVFAGLGGGAIIFVIAAVAAFAGIIRHASFGIGSE